MHTPSILKGYNAIQVSELIGRTHLVHRTWISSNSRAHLGHEAGVHPTYDWQLSGYSMLWVGFGEMVYTMQQIMGCPLIPHAT